MQRPDTLVFFNLKFNDHFLIVQLNYTKKRSVSKHILKERDNGGQ